MQPGFGGGVVCRTGRLASWGLPSQEIFFPCASLWVAGKVGHRTGHRTGRTVEPVALLAEPVAARPLPDILGIDAASGLAVGVVVVDVRIGRMPRALAYCHASSPPCSEELSACLGLRFGSSLVVFFGGPPYLLGISVAPPQLLGHSVYSPRYTRRTSKNT